MRMERQTRIITVKSFIVMRIYLACLPLLLLSCHGGKNETNPLPVRTERLYIDNSIQTRLESSQYEVEKVIELDLPPQMVLAGCDRMRIVGGHVYVLDRKGSKSVLVFDMSGRFCYRVGRVGHASDEIAREPTDFDVDARTGEIYLYDQFGGKLLIYRNDGGFKSYRLLDYMDAYAFGLTANGNLAFAFRMLQDGGRPSNELEVQNDRREPIAKYFPMDRHQLFTMNELPFGHVGRELCFIPNFSNKVYVLMGDTIARTVQIDFKSDFLPQETIDRIRYEEDMEAWRGKEKYVVNISEYSENEHLVYVAYYRGLLQRYVKDRKTGRELNGTSFFYGHFPWECMGISGRHIVFFVSQERIDEILKDRERLPDKEWESLYRKTNPVIRNMIEGKVRAPALLFVRLKP